MKKKVTFSFLLLFLSLSIYAQNDWRAGYIIKKNGDKVYGQIDYRAPRSNSAFCLFKENEEQLVGKKYLPEEIEGYRFVDGKYYISKSIQLGKKVKMVFLEYLIDGAVDIFFYTDDRKDRYYIQKDDQFLELKNTEKEVYEGNVRYNKELKEYVGVMNYFFADAKMNTAVNNTSLTHKSLIKTAKTYHDKVCFDQECVIYVKEKVPFKVDIGLTVGSFSKTLYLNENLGYFYHNSLSQYAGVAINIRNMSGIYERFSIHFEMLVAEYYLNDEKRYHFNVPFLVDYKLLATKVYPKVEAGLSMYFTSNEEYSVQNLRLMAGFSLNYDFYKDNRVYINTRVEGGGIVRFGGGVMF
ncbi:hypothetical protein [Flammeovirga sp. EKP202]|uniref:hypothetical protein n=1 Tax=Flammeovirga sp. EKP202 TaxID=2770592 RepID=UPI00165FCFD9|nr:hypothetical protein [Flammeovirga sp. EKP202]MBD0400148.1 hypothetical protein [Flammeovirga sp. EKP202]